MVSNASRLSFDVVVGICFHYLLELSLGGIKSSNIIATKNLTIDTRGARYPKN